MEREPRGVLAAFDELLKNPSAGVQRLITGDGTLRPALALLAGAIACYVMYGAASGFFQGGGQVLLAGLKAPLVVMFSVALCLPSLYILSALMGAEITATRLLVIVASFAGTLGIFMAGLLPITWLFSVSSRSLPFMVWMHLLLWGVTVILAGRCLQLLLRQIGARALIAPWVILFIVVSFQSATLFRPLIWQPPDAARFPGFTEKMSFFEHFGRSMDTPASALAPPEPDAANVDAILGAEHALARAMESKGPREAIAEFLAPDAIGFRPVLGSALEQLRALPPPDHARTNVRTPRVGDISAAGDLGWMTGPYTLSATGAPARHGVVLSIWKRQPDGSWRMLSEIATPAPEPVTFANEGFVRLPHAGGRFQNRWEEDSLRGLLGMDRMFAAEAQKKPVPTVYAQFLDSETPRLHRPNVAPLVGREAIRTYLESQPLDVTFRPIDGGVAASRDLGYTYGRYDTTPQAPGAAADSGYYLRVWSRWPSGQWTIAADVTTVDAVR